MSDKATGCGPLLLCGGCDGKDSKLVLLLPWDCWGMFIFGIDTYKCDGMCIGSGTLLPGLKIWIWGLLWVVLWPAIWAGTSIWGLLTVLFWMVGAGTFKTGTLWADMFFFASLSYSFVLAKVSYNSLITRSKYFYLSAHFLL